MNQKEINKQNLQDLLRVCVVLSELIAEKEVTEEEQERIDYCTKLLTTVTEKQKYINKEDK